MGLASSSLDDLLQSHIVSDLIAVDNGATDIDYAPVVPLSTCWLVQVSRRPEWTILKDDLITSATASQPNYTTTAVSNCQIHALYFIRSKDCTYFEEEMKHIRDIATSFYDLAVLAVARRGSIGTGAELQPLHIASVESMVEALDTLRL